MAAENPKKPLIEYEKNGHTIVVSGSGKTLTLESNGQVIARTSRGLVLREEGYKPVYYIPIEDVKPGVLAPTSKKTFCPFKGTANYYTLLAGDRKFENSVWQYAESTDEFAAIQNYVAFYDSAIDDIIES